MHGCEHVISQIGGNIGEKAGTEITMFAFMIYVIKIQNDSGNYYDSVFTFDVNDGYEHEIQQIGENNGDEAGTGDNYDSIYNGDANDGCEHQIQQINGYM